MGAEQATAEAQQLEQIAQILQKHARARQELIPVLQDVQDVLGYLSPEALQQVADYLDLSVNEVYGVATFYTQFRFNAPGKYHIKVCRGTACHVRGSGLSVEGISRKLGISDGETTKDRMFSLETVACFGSCALAPVVVVNDKVYGRMNPRKVEKLLNELSNGL